MARKLKNVLFCAAKRFGKTEAVKGIIEKYKKANPNNGIFYFSQSGKPESFPKSVVCTRGTFEEVFEVLESCQNILVIFDDAKYFINATNVKTREEIKKKLSDSRHYGIEIVLCLQSLNQLPTDSEFLTGGIVDEIYLGNTRAPYASVEDKCEMIGISEDLYLETLGYEFPEVSKKPPKFLKISLT